MESFQIGVKKLLARCLQEEQLPSVSQIAYLAYILCPSRSNQKREAEREAEAQANASVLFVSAELLKETFSKCAAQLKVKQHSFTTADGNALCTGNTLTSPPWNCLCGLGDDMTLPLSEGWTPLCFLSLHTCLNAHITMAIMAQLNCDCTRTLLGLGEVWRVYCRGLFEHCLIQCSSSGDWHVLLVRLALCLLVKDVVKTITQYKYEGVAQEEPDRRDPIKPESHKVMEGSGLVGAWQCEDVLGPVVGSVAESFSDLFHHRQTEYEKEEMSELEGQSLNRQTGTQVLKVSKTSSSFPLYLMCLLHFAECRFLWQQYSSLE